MKGYDMKTGKKVMIGIGVFLLLLLIIWGICETAGSDYYNYKGFVVDIVEENGETVIVTLSGDTESRFTLKWYSRKKYEKEPKDIQIGDCVMLSTTQHSSTNIKKISVNYGYSLEGKIFYVDELPDRPFLFISEPLYGTQLFDLIPSDEKMLDDLETGDRVRVYCDYPIGASAVTVQVNGLFYISEGSIEDFSDAEKDFIVESGYSIKE